MKRLLMGTTVLAAAAYLLGRQRRPTTEPTQSAPPDGRGQTSDGAAPQADLGERGRRPSWQRVAGSVRRRIRTENITLTSAGLAFYAFLALVPALIAMVTVYGLVSDPSDVERQVADLAEALPESARAVIEEQLTSIVSGPSAGLGIGLAVSLTAALWTASGGTAALVRGINSAFGEEETRGFLKLRGMSLALTVGALVLLGLVGFVATALPLILGGIEFGGLGRTTVDVGRWLFLLMAVVASITILYRIAPDRDASQRRLASWGALVAAGLWVTATLGFSFYVSTFGSYSQTYGFLGGVVVLLLWFFLSGFAVLLGAVLDAELEGMPRTRA